MSLVPWLRQILSSPVASRRRSAQVGMKCRLEFIQLEDRLAPAIAVATATLVNPPSPINEGTTLNLTATVTGATGAVSYTWTVAATTSNGTTTTTSSPSASPNFSFLANDNGTYNVSVAASDALPSTATLAVSPFSVLNVAPIADVDGPTTGTFGTPLTFNLTATDVPPDAAAGFTYTIDWNDGTPVETIPPTANNGSGITATHTFAQPGVNTFSVTATDKDGGVSDPVTHTVTATGAAVIDGTLVVAGTAGNDVIAIGPKGKPTAENATVKLSLNGVKRVFTGVNSINIIALEGNDNVHLAGSIRVPATIDGGAGNDRIKGGKGADLILGGDGNDSLNGHQGNDVIIGGNGADRILGGPGDDLLIAGATIYDADADALAALLDTWNGPGTFQDHVAALMDPLAPVHLIADGTGATVTDDGAADRVTGASGKEWIFATTPQDKVTGKFEFLNGLETSKPGKNKPAKVKVGSQGNGQGHGKNK